MNNELFTFEHGPVFGLAVAWEKVSYRQWDIIVIIPFCSITIRVGKGWGRK